MKRNVIISGIAVLAVSTGIISYMVSAAPQPTEESQSSTTKVESIVVPETKDSLTPTIQTTETPVVEAVEVAPSAPTEQKPAYLSREEASAVIVSTVSTNWNAKETGIMISNSNLTALMLKSYDASPEDFTKSSTASLTLACIDKLKAMPKEEAVRFVYGESCL